MITPQSIALYADAHAGLGIYFFAIEKCRLSNCVTESCFHVTLFTVCSSSHFPYTSNPLQNVLYTSGFLKCFCTEKQILGDGNCLCLHGQTVLMTYANSECPGQTARSRSCLLARTFAVLIHILLYICFLKKTVNTKQRMR